MKQLLKQCREIIDCDTARITQPCERMYLIIGFNKNTKNDEGQWHKDGKPIDFDYTSGQVVASGKTAEELISSCLEYKRLCGITLEEYMKEVLSNTDK